MHSPIWIVPSMLPTEIIEWAIWAHLNSIRSVELILLKGHLALEAVLDDLLARNYEISQKKVREMSYHRKVEVLTKLTDSNEKKKLVALKYCRDLNNIRNRLAHEFAFKDGEESLTLWADGVLRHIPGTKFGHHTSRTKVIHAIGSIARSLHIQGVA